MTRPAPPNAEVDLMEQVKRGVIRRRQVPSGRRFNGSAGQWGSLTNLDGVLGRSLPAEEQVQSFVPTIKLVGPCLRWSFGGDDDWVVISAAGALDGFVRLGDAPGEEILQYARRWGVLQLCRHLKPCTHAPAICTPAGVEPLTTWQQYASEAQNILNRATELHRDPPRTGRQRVKAWGHIFGRVTEWLHMATGRLVLDSTGSWTKWPAGMRLGVAADGLFGVLALQLALAVLRADGLYACSGCRLPYAPTTRPALGKRHFCPDCRGRGVPVRLAVQDYRRRKRSRRAPHPAAGRR
jgi:hypothetical protein